jgi:hypothetical protein
MELSKLAGLDTLRSEMSEQEKLLQTQQKAAKTSGAEVAYNASTTSAVGGAPGALPEPPSPTKIVGAIVIWYTCSISLIMYNKWMLSYLGFHFPIALMLIHQILCSIAAYVSINFLNMTTPLNLSWDQIIKNVAPVALVFSCSISFVNYGQMYISVKFIQMLKASLPTVSLIIGFAIGLEQPSWPMFLCICWICSGVIIAGLAELDLEFHFIGTCLAMTGFIFESLRLVLSQKLLQASAIKFNPMTGVYYTAPLSFCALSIPFLLLESSRFFEYLGATHPSGSTNLVAMAPYMLTNGMLAYALNLSVYNVIQHTSAVTFGVLGQAKDWLNVCVALVVFQSPITIQQGVGYCIAVAGVFYYKRIRTLQSQQQRLAAALAAGPGGPGAEKV